MPTTIGYGAVPTHVSSVTSMQTPWPVIWSRSLRSSQAVARRNALGAARTLNERRREREAVDAYIRTRADAPARPTMRVNGE